MPLESTLLFQFKEQLKRAREANEAAWTFSRTLVTQSSFATTLRKLVEAIEGSSVPGPLREALIASLKLETTAQKPPLHGQAIKDLTGLSTTKAIRALCVFFGLAVPVADRAPVTRLSQADIEHILRTESNPFDVLLHADVASVLELGAGDLSFAYELVDLYGDRLQGQGKELTLHCLDRIRPGSPLAGPLQADPLVLQKLRGSPGLHFRFWGNLDMFELETVKGIWPRYTIVTCYAPATPAFAYEPTRISASLIQQHLRATKGEFQSTRFQGEEALEVRHRGRSLLFPLWKFEIRGPLALLDLCARRGKVCILGSVDSQVFWEILSQLLADPGLRPTDAVFDPSIIADLFGPIYTRLSELPIGGSLVVSDMAELRPAMPRVLPGREDHPPYRFRYVEIRRGALFPGIPSGKTARLFETMAEEEAPWFLTLLPDDQSH